MRVQSGTKLPKFKITRAEDDTLEFSPEIGTRELADALSYHYPMRKTLLEKMQQASLDFLTQEASNSSSKNENLRNKDLEIASEYRHDLGVTQESSFANASLKDQNNMPFPPNPVTSTPLNAHLAVWHVETGNPAHQRGKKRPYNAMKRKIVAANRGNTCEKHKKSRTRCDPSRCPQNKLFIKRAAFKEESSKSHHETIATPAGSSDYVQFDSSKRLKPLSSGSEMEQSEWMLEFLENSNSEGFYSHGSYCLTPFSNSAIGRSPDDISPTSLHTTPLYADPPCAGLLDDLEISSNDTETGIFDLQSSEMYQSNDKGIEQFPISWLPNTSIENQSQDRVDISMTNNYRQKSASGAPEAGEWIDYDDQDEIWPGTDCAPPGDPALSVIVTHQTARKRRSRKRSKKLPVCMQVESDKFRLSHNHAGNHQQSEEPHPAKDGFTYRDTQSSNLFKEDVAYQPNTATMYPDYLIPDLSTHSGSGFDLGSSADYAISLHDEIEVEHSPFIISDFCGRRASDQVQGDQYPSSDATYEHHVRRQFLASRSPRFKSRSDFGFIVDFLPRNDWAACRYVEHGVAIRNHFLADGSIASVAASVIITLWLLYILLIKVRIPKPELPQAFLIKKQLDDLKEPRHVPGAFYEEENLVS